MVKCISLMRRLCDRIPDCIWPHLEGPADPAPEDQVYFSAKHAELLDGVKHILTSRLAQVEKREQTVESKLTALLTLTSVLSAAVTVSLAAAATLRTVGEDARIFVWVAVFLVFYVVVQLLRSLWVTVGGLMRRSYRQLSLADIAPQDGEASEAYRVRLLNLQANYMRWNEWVVDQKVSAMAVAHIALRNALTATFALIVLAAVIAFVHLAGGSGIWKVCG